MKKIQSLNGFWSNSGFQAAEFFKTYLIFDNLEDTAKFYFEFLSSEQTMLANGNFDITGEDYQLWDGSNSYVWNFAVQKFGLILEETK